MSDVEKPDVGGGGGSGTDAAHITASNGNGKVDEKSCAALSSMR